jgi:hypothetical protein
VEGGIVAKGVAAGNIQASFSAGADNCSTMQGALHAMWIRRTRMSATGGAGVVPALLAPRCPQQQPAMPCLVIVLTKSGRAQTSILSWHLSVFFCLWPCVVCRNAEASCPAGGAAPVALLGAMC